MAELDPVWIEWPHARVRRNLDIDHGVVTRFVVQLEYNIATLKPDVEAPEWCVVARFDHDSTSPGGHDITQEGLHLDIYRDGERFERLKGFPTFPAGRAMRYCEEYLLRYSAQLLSRFEYWHELRGPWSRS